MHEQNCLPFVQGCLRIETIVLSEHIPKFTQSTCCRLDERHFVLEFVEFVLGLTDAAGLRCKEYTISSAFARES